MRFLSWTIAIALLATPADAAAVGVAIAAAFSAITSTAAGAFLLRLGAGLALSALSRALAPKPKQATQGIKTEVTSTGGITPQSFPIGWYATGGQHVCPPMSHGRAGDVRNAYLTYVIDLSDMPITALDKIIINSEEVTFSVNVHPDYGVEAAGRYAGHLWYKFYDGTQTVADPMLLAEYGEYPDRPWLADMVGEGVPYVILTFKFNAKIYSGLPSFRAVVEGIPLYDPRYDTTAGGSGAQRWNDSSTWGFSRNPAVMVYNILRGIALPDGSTWGLDAEAEDLDLSVWAAAMNACEEQEDLDEGTENRYRAGYEVKVDEEPLGVIDEILKACSGDLVEVGGSWYIRVGGAEVPSYFITDEDILRSEGQDYAPFPGLASTFNGIHASYPEPSSLWETKDAPPRYDNDLEVTDQGRRLIAELNLPACPYGDQVQRLMKSYIDDERRFRQHAIGLPPEAIGLRPLETLAWTSARNGYDAKLFEVSGQTLAPRSLNSTFQLRERDPSDYSWSTDFTLPTDTPSVVVTQPDDVGVPGFNVEAITVQDALGADRRPAIRISWNPTLSGIEAIQWQVRVAATAVAVAGGSTHDIENGSVIVSDGILAITAYQVRARLVTDDPSAWEPWALVTTADVKITVDDLDDTITDKLDDFDTLNAEFDHLVGSYTGTLLELQLDGDLAQNAIDQAEAARDAAQLASTSAAASLVGSEAAQGFAEAAQAAAEAAAVTASEESGVSVSLIAELFPSNFQQDSTYWSRLINAPDTNGADLIDVTFHDTPAGRVARTTVDEDFEFIAPRGFIAPVAGNTYRAKVRFRQTAGPLRSVSIVGREFDENWADGASVYASATPPALNQFVDFECEWTAPASPLPYFRFATYVLPTDRIGNTYEFLTFEIADVTQAKAAEGFATASSTFATAAGVSATEAGTEADAAAISATQAATERAAAGVSAGQAASAASEADGSASTAATFATAAADAEANSGASAAASASSASAAAASATDAAQEASAASSARLGAEAAEASSEVFRNEAAAAAVDAEGSAAAAAVSEGVTVKIARDSLPSTFDDDGLYWALGSTGDPASKPDLVPDDERSYVDDPAGRLLRLKNDGSGNLGFAPKGLLRVLPDRTYRTAVTARLRPSSPTSASLVIQNRTLDANYANVVVENTFVQILDTPNVWVTFSRDYTAPSTPGSRVWFAPYVYMNASAAPPILDDEIDILSVLVEDVTEEVLAFGHAEASALSETNAAVSATEAESFATVATQQAVIATTKSGEASVFATQAASSAEDADGSAQSAATDANTSTSASNAAGASAAAASNAATGAASFASDAEQSAIASSGFSNQAQVASASALNSANTASNFATQASASAAAAGSSVTVAASVVATLMPGDFEQEGTFFGHGNFNDGGDALSALSTAPEVTWVNDGGRCLQYTADNTNFGVMGRGVVITEPGRTYRFRVEIKQVSGTINGTSFRLYMRRHEMNYNDYLDVSAGRQIDQIGAWEIHDITYYQDNHTYIRLHPFIYFNEAQTSNGNVFRIRKFVVEDITDTQNLNAEVTQLSLATADIEGNLGAMYALRVSAGGASAGLEIVAADDPVSGPSSTLRMDADKILFDGSVYVKHLTIDENLDIAAATGAFRFGKNSVSDFNNDGIYIGRTLETNGSTGFGFHAGRVSGGVEEYIRHTKSTGLEIKNASFLIGAGTGTETTRQVSGTYSLAAGTQSISLEIQAGGGGGGGAGAGILGGPDPALNGNAGGNTVVRLLNGSTQISIWTANGGSGGLGALIPGSSGGAGGKAAASPRGDGGDGAGGDGGTSPRSGGGGSAGQFLSLSNIDVSGLSTPRLQITIGGGGARGDVRAENGTAGQVKYAQFSTTAVRASPLASVSTARGTFLATSGVAGVFPVFEPGQGVWILFNLPNNFQIFAGTGEPYPCDTSTATIIADFTPYFSNQHTQTRTIYYQFFPMWIP